ncbi:hypothetical protein HPB50_022063 [Hyalomma asiaticum]|uniref:Uncharacterized protein n=1 Tax=Hyalomma asiaticum TaxID=266040 RepID=A0ACB7SAV4_HYAAI|nr:hypothetical protein HPB50_022063 [Hyalomma asiaticum]
MSAILMGYVTRLKRNKAIGTTVTTSSGSSSSGGGSVRRQRAALSFRLSSLRYADFLIEYADELLMVPFDRRDD